MGRLPKPIDTTYPRRAELATALRDLRDARSLTYEDMARKCNTSAATLKRAAAGVRVPKQKVVEEFARACGEDPLTIRTLEHMRVKARIEERGILKTLRAPQVHLISDKPDLAQALLYVYEAAGAPSLREVHDRCGNPHALPVSTIGRIVARTTTPADEKQLLAFLHGCGIRNRDQDWLKAWEKATSPEGGLFASRIVDFVSDPALIVSPSFGQEWRADLAKAAATQFYPVQGQMKHRLSRPTSLRLQRGETRTG
ncbi:MULTISPECIES: helix-turn-helix domain-containing protein [Streptomyces]|uniref:Helix-turn-helix transcriptional regulator n=1 Tax=Streptomyces virginiae TaxID=1961 RepID=A0ABZ1T4W4_STRVG|nr:helix-turn-helix transcriptional regulator [Streptomyces virginiae]WTB20253.1 helix-turn-helix transcriptional regulator [Streptomyces virginiae]